LTGSFVLDLLHLALWHKRNRDIDDAAALALLAGFGFCAVILWAMTRWFGWFQREAERPLDGRLKVREVDQLTDEEKGEKPPPDWDGR
jgi:hypothetical protein